MKFRLTAVLRSPCFIRGVSRECGMYGESVSRYRRPLRLVWEIKYWGLRKLNIITYYLFFYKIKETYLCCLPDLVVCLVAIACTLPLPMKGVTTGSPSSKYEHRHCCVTSEISRKYKDLYGKKPIVSVTYENKRISIKKNSLLYLKCVLRLSCVVHEPIYGL